MDGKKRNPDLAGTDTTAQLTTRVAGNDEIGAEEESQEATFAEQETISRPVPAETTVTAAFDLDIELGSIVTSEHWTLSAAVNGLIMVDATVAGKQYPFLVDTGAESSLMPGTVAEEALLKIDQRP